MEKWKKERFEMGGDSAACRVKGLEFEGMLNDRLVFNRPVQYASSSLWMHRARVLKIVEMRKAVWTCLLQIHTLFFLNFL